MKSAVFRRLRSALVIAGSVILLTLLVIVITNCVILRFSGERILLPEELDGDYDCIVVLGAGLKQDGTPSDMLRDRLDTAIALYRQGISDKMILTGDCSGDDYDEVGSMFAYCRRQGIPESALVRDNDGFSTYESMDHVVHDENACRFVVVTQKYHLFRAIYIAGKMDADPVGGSADVRKYRGEGVRLIREYLARTKDYFQVLFS